MITRCFLRRSDALTARTAPWLWQLDGADSFSHREMRGTAVWEERDDGEFGWVPNCRVAREEERQNRRSRMRPWQRTIARSFAPT